MSDWRCAACLSVLPGAWEYDMWCETCQSDALGLPAEVLGDGRTGLDTDPGHPGELPVCLGVDTSQAPLDPHSLTGGLPVARAIAEDAERALAALWARVEAS